MTRQSSHRPARRGSLGALLVIATFGSGPGSARAQKSPPADLAKSSPPVLVKAPPGALTCGAEVARSHTHLTPLVIALPTGAIGVAGDKVKDPRVLLIAEPVPASKGTLFCAQHCEGCGACTTYVTEGRLVNGTNGGNSTYTGSGSCTCTGGTTVPYSGCANAGMTIWTGGTYAGSGSAVGKGCADAACAAAGQGSCNLAGLVQNTIAKDKTQEAPGSVTGRGP